LAQILGKVYICWSSSLQALSSKDPPRIVFIYLDHFGVQSIVNHFKLHKFKQVRIVDLFSQLFCPLLHLLGSGIHTWWSNTQHQRSEDPKRSFLHLDHFWVLFTSDDSRGLKSNQV
jgi:hypothetical protein